MPLYKLLGCCGDITLPLNEVEEEQTDGAWLNTARGGASCKGSEGKGIPVIFTVDIWSLAARISAGIKEMHAQRLNI